MKQEKIPGIPGPQTESILNLFKSGFPKKIEIVLFGSRAKGNHREGSDIDLAVKGEKISLDDRDAWLSKYESLNLPWRLDIVVYRLIEEPALKEHIDRVGKTVLVIA